MQLLPPGFERSILIESVQILFERQEQLQKLDRVFDRLALPVSLDFTFGGAVALVEILNVLALRLTFLCPTSG